MQSVWEKSSRLFLIKFGKILEAMYQEYGVEIPQAEWGIEIPQNLFLIPEILLSARVEQGASQEEISEGICTPETYSRIETGKRSPSLKNLEAYCW